MASLAVVLKLKLELQACLSGEAIHDFPDVLSDASSVPGGLKRDRERETSQAGGVSSRFPIDREIVLGTIETGPRFRTSGLHQD